ncbi:hypothetical protein AGMMS50249_7570 [candidate division SR1 bacterium]|nr:hypothetical protein AGMMS50249_7570 [candidate division SR1 bacterium]
MVAKKSTIPQEVTAVMDDVKESAHDVGTRWKRSSIEEKICTVLGIFVFAWGLRCLKHLIGGILLLLIGGILISGVLNAPLRQFFRMITGPSEDKKSAKKAKTSEPAKAPTKAPKKSK